MINVTLTFNGNKSVLLDSQDADEKKLLEIMFQTPGWKAEKTEGGAIRLTPAKFTE